MRIQILVTLIVLRMLVTPCQAQTPSQDLRAMAGPWECIDSKGIHGISIFATTTLVERDGTKDITSQTVDVRAYERNGNATVGGFTSVNRDASRGAVLNGTHLIIHQPERITPRPNNFIVLPNGTKVEIAGPPIKGIPGYDLDVQFDSVKQQWTGSWSLCDKTGEKVLERPHPGEGMAADMLVGDWIGSPDPRPQSLIGIIPEALGTLHIRQASDGTFISWLDENNDFGNDRLGTRTVSQRDGDEIHFNSTVSNAIAFEITYYCTACSASSRYEGILSADGMTLSGKWFWRGALSFGETAVPTVFRRMN